MEIDKKISLALINELKLMKNLLDTFEEFSYSIFLETKKYSEYKNTSEIVKRFKFVSSNLSFYISSIEEKLGGLMSSNDYLTERVEYLEKTLDICELNNRLQKLIYDKIIYEKITKEKGDKI